jgi:RNA polymerase sigma factor (sigma-70 family)
MYDDARWAAIAAHRERLLRMARRRCPTRADAEDVVQEALLRCATFPDLDEARIGQFLTSVTTRLCADTYRHAERQARAAGRLGGETPPAADPADVACRDADVQELASLLATLPERQRAVLVDRASGLSVGQIGSRHALSYKAVESALSRARAAMRMALASMASVVFPPLALRRRRALAVAGFPVAALAFLTAVQHGLVHWPDGADHGRAVRRVDAGTAVPVTSAVTGAVARPAARTRSLRPPAARPGTHLAPDPAKDDLVRVRDPLLGSDVRVYDHTEPQTPAEIVAQCVNGGAWVYVNYSPKTVGYKDGCGKPPPDGPDTLVVHTNPRPPNLGSPA